MRVPSLAVGLLISQLRVDGEGACYLAVPGTVEPRWYLGRRTGAEAACRPRLKRADLKGVAGLVLDEVKDDPLRRHRVVLPFRRAQPAPLLGGDLLERFQEDLPAAGKATQVRLQRLAEHRSETLVRTTRGKGKVRLHVLW